MINNFLHQITPPFIWELLLDIRSKKISILKKISNNNSKKQDLDMYWDPKMAEMLETWGDGNVWNEIQFILYNCNGKVLDVACGTGKTIEILSKYSRLELYGCDISDFLIKKAIERGIPKEYLETCDATQTNYLDNYFDFTYSIGSLEHFTEDGINPFIEECSRITKFSSFHNIPVSRSGKNEGWLKRSQSYHNNSVEWWFEKFNSSYKQVHAVDSCWQDKISVGKWFLCSNI